MTAFCAILVSALPAFGVTLTLPFVEDFEPPWDRVGEWASCETPFASCPTDDPIVVSGHESYGWGPLKFETWDQGPPNDPVFSGERAGRQPIFDPYYSAIRHDFNPPPGGNLHLRVMQYDYANTLCDCDPYGPPSRPNFDVHGWIVLTNPNRTEYYVLGVNSKQSWTHLSWATSTDGWNVTTVARVQGWRKMEIIVHPYTGGSSDVEFLVDDNVVATGHRAAGTGEGIDVSWLTLGGDPVLLPEGRFTNTFDQFWYDDVLLEIPVEAPECPNTEIRFDADADDDVDHEDFGYLQRCLTGPDDPDNAYESSLCHCFDVDDDLDVDQDDFDAFLLCASGPDVPAATDCDDSAPVP